MIKITVGLIGHSANSPNLGIGALTVSNVNIIEKSLENKNVDLSFKIFQWNDPGPYYFTRDNIEVVTIRARHVFLHPTFLFELRECDIVFDMSAGDSFADLYGVRRFALSALSKLCVLIVRRPLVLPPQTIGPFNRSIFKWLAGLLMRSARAVVTRDDLSTEFARQFGLDQKLVESTDVAFKLPYDLPVKGTKSSVKVGINVSGLLFNGGYTRQNMFDLQSNYEDMIRSLIRRFLEQDQCVVHLVPHVIPHDVPVEDDHLVSKLLSEEFPEVVVAPRFEGPSAAKSYIAGLDFFCGSRMHACIAAFSSGVPVLPIAYSRKFAGVFGALGYSWLADCKSMSSETVVDVVLDAYMRRDELKADVDAGMEQALHKLAAYEQLIDREMRLLIDGRHHG